jgi:prefoldin alpha subunit
MDKQQQELIYKLSLFEQQIKLLQQEIEAVDQAIIDATTLNGGLDDLKKAKGRDILAPLGKGIFIKGKIESEDLIVDIGNKNFVKKTIPETQELIKTQIEKLGELKKELDDGLEKVNEELTKTFMEAQGQEED